MMDMAKAQALEFPGEGEAFVGILKGICNYLKSAWAYIPVLWIEATSEERRRLINTLIEMVYVNLETKQVDVLRPKTSFSCPAWHCN